VTNVSRQLPAATVSRLPRYLRYLEGPAGGSDIVSSEEIADGSGVTAVQVRKDLSFLGAPGTRGVGYHTNELRHRLERELGLAERLGVAIVGAGNLGSALANYQGFTPRGFDMVAIYDVSSNAVGSEIGGLTVSHLDELPADVERLSIGIGMIATPATAAQEVAALMGASGIAAILNFAPVELRVPSTVHVRRVDPSTDLRILAYHLAQREA
jgi:redox-sensing transcriptional repressor